MHTTRYAKESNPERIWPTTMTAPIFILQEPPRSITPSHHPPLARVVRLPWPAVHTFRAWTSPAGRWGRGSWGVFGGAVLLGPMRAALSLGVPTERWDTEVRACSGAFCIAIVALCLLLDPMCHRPSSVVSRRQAGSREYGWHNGVFCFAPWVRWPPICV